MSRYDTSQASRAYGWYVVAALATVYTVAVMDRAVLSILQVPIKEELGLSDSQLGLLTGLAFGAFYAILSVPVARIADRGNRLHVVCGALVLWSLMTAGCGLAMGFLTLLLFRMGVGIGEAGGYPPSASILSDYFTRDRRATALAIFGLGAPLGQTLGIFSAGWLNEVMGWRSTFVIIGAFGVLLAPIVLLTVREPRRGGSDEVAAQVEGPTPNLWQVAGFLWRLKTLRYLYAANMCHGFVAAAYASWTPPLYTRAFDLSTATAANWLGLLSIAGAAGTFAGGAIADKLGKRDGRWYMWVVAAAGAVLVPTAIAQFMAGSLAASLTIAILPSLLIMFFVGPTIAVGQSLVQPHMRATAAAFMPLLYNIFGLGLGPLLVGVLSDVFHPRFGDDGLRYALSIAMLMELLAATFYFLSGRRYAVDMARDRTLDFLPARATPQGSLM